MTFATQGWQKQHQTFAGVFTSFCPDERPAEQHTGAGGPERPGLGARSHGRPHPAPAEPRIQRKDVT
jgi:hypothetical protein